jgi:predicted small lipoprotein YifL
MTRTLLVVLALALAAGSLSACGKKSRLDPPPGEKSTWPKVYPRE